jgi:spore coat polysaccharide biosynthesis predicted glycosyltransferase SpsG
LSGGSDTTGVGRTLPTLLNEALPAGTHLEWITGPYAQQPVFPEFARFTLVNYQAPSCLDNFMVSTNYAMTVYGVSFFELLHYGVPTVVFSPYGNNDDAELSAIAEAGVALVARDEVEAVNMLKELMADSSLAASMSQQARQKLSILGDNKFVQAVKALLV